jgi:hypothetical protein
MDSIGFLPAIASATSVNEALSVVSECKCLLGFLRVRIPLQFSKERTTILVDSELTCAVNFIGESTLGLNIFVCLNSLQGDLMNDTHTLYSVVHLSTLLERNLNVLALKAFPIQASNIHVCCLFPLNFQGPLLCIILFCVFIFK